MVTLRQAASYALCCVVVVILYPVAAFANTIDVNPGDQISAALASAAAGDTVLVHCGTYDEQGLQMPSGVTLRSEGGDPACVTIASQGADPVLRCTDLPLVSRIEGITFTVAAGGLVAPVARGAGLYISNAAPSISQCVFVDLEADYGGAIYCDDGAVPVFYRCSFTGNLARAVGGAMNCVGTASPTVANCLFADNEAVAGGHAVNASRGATPHLVSSTFSHNEALGGASLMAFDDSVIDLNNSIVFNGVQGKAWAGDYESAPLIACSDLYAIGRNAWPGLLAAMSGSNGNFSADPLFCGDLGGGLPFTLDEVSPCASENSGCGQVGAFPVACTNSTVVGIPETLEQMLPRVTRLRGNYPNPFNPRTTIRYDVQEAGQVNIAIYDVAGRLIKRLVDSNQLAGSHDVQWLGVDQSGRPVGAGVYFVQLKTKLTRDTSSVSLIK